MLSDGGTRWLSGELGHGWSGENSKKKEEKEFGYGVVGCGVHGGLHPPSILKAPFITGQLKLDSVQIKHLMLLKLIVCG
jgi:hypothetical protein